MLRPSPNHGALQLPNDDDDDDDDDENVLLLYFIHLFRVFPNNYTLYVLCVFTCHTAMCLMYVHLTLLYSNVSYVCTCVLCVSIMCLVCVHLTL